MTLNLFKKFNGVWKNLWKIFNGVWENLWKKYSAEKYNISELYTTIKSTSLEELQNGVPSDSEDQIIKRIALRQKLEILRNIGENHKDGDYVLTVVIAVITIFFTLVLGFISVGPDGIGCGITPPSSKHQGTMDCAISSTSISNGATSILAAAVVILLVLLLSLLVRRFYNEKKSNKLLGAIYIMQEMEKHDSTSDQSEEKKKDGVVTRHHN